MRLLLTVLVFCLMSSQAWACPKGSDPLPVDTVIRQTENIILARVKSAEFIKNLELGFENNWDNLIEYSFETIEVIKGNEFKGDFIYQGRPTVHLRDIDDFNKHSDQNFWDKNYEGRTQDNCYLPLDPFAVGSTYLLFGKLDIDFPKKAEVIFYNDDYWLQYVREKVKQQASELSNE